MSTLQTPPSDQASDSWSNKAAAQRYAYDFIIVGQGLAGSILAWSLLQNGVNVLVIDEQHKDAASMVAAGIINPITGHRINVTDNIEQFLPSALKLYAAMEKQFHTPLAHALPQLRLIKKQGQLDYWQQRKQQSSHQAYLGELHDEHEAFTSTAFGVAEIKQTYRIDTQQLLQCCRDWLIKQDALYEQRFDYKALNQHESSVEYCGMHAKGIIFCEGFQAIHNPWWQHLPFKLAKGEIISLESNKLPEIMLNWGNWLLPTNQQAISSTTIKPQYKLGSNYVWNDIELTPSSAVRQHLLNTLQNNISAQADVIAHQVGIRPTTLHRQAFVGKHPKHQRLFCFNGFGSKGCLTMPLHADLLMNHLLHGLELPVHLTQHL